ncbi:lipoprotein [Salmonella enterica subsp. enterica serovar Choleraesuis]|nr:lipoprotein [Salmonella enterica subsp. enterica serovar Choleraesuis]
MRYPLIAMLAPCALLLSACSTLTTTVDPTYSTVTPAYKDVGTRLSTCVEGGPDTVAQKFYDYRIQHPSTGLNDLTSLRPWLSESLYKMLSDDLRQPETQAKVRGDIFSSASEGINTADVASSSLIPNTDARNVPLRVTFTKGSKTWQDEVLMVREGKCWAIDDVRYLGASNAPSGNLRQSLGRF